MQISLRAGSKLYLNGAVIKVDRKVNIELMNDVVFLLESHVLQPDEANSPLKQLYFVIQTILMDPSGAAEAKSMVDAMLLKLAHTFENRDVLWGLQEVSAHLKANRPFDALKTVRNLFAIEAQILAERPVNQAPNCAA